MKSLVKFFFQGLLVLLPLTLTAYLVYLIFTALDEILFSMIGLGVNRLFPQLTAGWIQALLGFSLTLAFIIGVGLLVSNWVGRKLLSFVEALFEKIPLVTLLYGSIKDMLSALIGDRKSFDRPVYIEMPGSGGKLLGFITCASPDFPELPDHVAVYLPQSYNIAGHVVLFPQEQVHPLTTTSAGLTTFILSGGVSGSTGKNAPPVSN